MHIVLKCGIVDTTPRTHFHVLVWAKILHRTNASVHSTSHVPYKDVACISRMFWRDSRGCTLQIMKIIPIIHSLMGELLVVIMVHLGNALERFEGSQGPPVLM